MAKVGTEQITHKGSGKHIWCVVNFINKSKKFVISDFPEEIKDWYASKRTREEIGSKLYQGDIYAESYNDCVTLAKKVYSEYHELNISEEKIIAYELKTNHPRPEFFGHKDRNDLYHAPRLAIGIQFAVMYRIRIGEESFLSHQPYEQAREPEEGNRLGAKRLIREDSNGSSYTRWEKIPYSEETHNFFLKVEAGLLNMINKVNDFFGDSPTALLEKIKTGKFLD